jgi:hypothetical protein
MSIGDRWNERRSSSSNSFFDNDTNGMTPGLATEMVVKPLKDCLSALGHANAVKSTPSNQSGREVTQVLLDTVLSTLYPPAAIAEKGSSLPTTPEAPMPESAEVLTEATHRPK